MGTPVAEPLRLSDFDFELPESLIAQEPAPVRDRSRLLLLGRTTGSLEHGIFSDLKNHLVPGDLLVLNNTRVFPCRLAARKQGGGSSEIFLLGERRPNVWTALVKGRLTTGRSLHLEQGIRAEITADNEDGTKEVCFSGVGDIRAVLSKLGKTPLPPYIKREPSIEDRARYQTVYADREGAVAAPTAGLHFTPELIDTLTKRGIEFTAITLHVGPGTFQPVRTELIAEHRMLPEQYDVPSEAAAAINHARSQGRRVIAVGTTSVRTIESSTNGNGEVRPGRGSSELFISPGYRFAATDGLITNFHLPKSTLLMLVSAFAGRERILDAYRTAIARKYRFYSYGDAMLIL